MRKDESMRNLKFKPQVRLTVINLIKIPYFHTTVF